MLNVDIQENNEQLKNVIKTLKNKYCDSITSQLQNKFNLKNKLACPKITHIVLSKGLSTVPGKLIDQDKAIKNLENIAGQKPIAIKAKRSVSQFKISEGRINGCKVTLRRHSMYFFLEKLIEYYFVVKRTFSGIKLSSFNKQKKNISVSIGIDDERLFPEIVGSSSTFREGFNVTIVTNATNLEHAAFLMTNIGIPIRN